MEQILIISKKGQISKRTTKTIVKSITRLKQLLYIRRFFTLYEKLFSDKYYLLDNYPIKIDNRVLPFFE